MDDYTEEEEVRTKELTIFRVKYQGDEFWYNIEYPAALWGALTIATALLGYGALSAGGLLGTPMALWILFPSLLLLNTVAVVFLVWGTGLFLFEMVEVEDEDGETQIIFLDQDGEESEFVWGVFK